MTPASPNAARQKRFAVTTVRTLLELTGSSTGIARGRETPGARKDGRAAHSGNTGGALVR